MAERTLAEIEQFNQGYRIGLQFAKSIETTKRETKGIETTEDDMLEMIGREIVQVIRADVARTLAQHREQVTALERRISELETMVLELTERK